MENSMNAGQRGTARKTGQSAQGAQATQGTLGAQGTLGTGTQTGQGAQDNARGLKEQAAQGARQLMDRAQTQIETRVSEQKTAASRTLTSVAHHLHESSAELRTGQHGIAGEYIGKVADQIERAARYVENAEPGDIVNNVERFARRQPAVFIGAAFVVGLIGARFLKSSQSRAYSYGETVSVGFADREVSTVVETDTLIGSAGDARTRPVGGGLS